MPTASPTESIQKRRQGTTRNHQIMLMRQRLGVRTRAPRWPQCPPIAWNPRPYWLCGHTDATESTEKYAFSLGKPFFLH